MDPTKRVNDLIVITGRLADLLERENLALRNKENKYLNDILDEKVTLGRVYETRIMGLAEDSETLESVDSELLERLQGIGKKVNGLIEENAELLRVATSFQARCRPISG